MCRPPTGLSCGWGRGEGCPERSSPKHSQPRSLPSPPSQALLLLPPTLRLTVPRSCPQTLCLLARVSLSRMCSSTPPDSQPQSPPPLTLEHPHARSRGSADLLHPNSLPAASPSYPLPPAPAPIASSCSPTSKASLSVMEREVVRQLRY